MENDCIVLEFLLPFAQIVNCEVKPLIRYELITDNCGQLPRTFKSSQFSVVDSVPIGYGFA